MSSFDLLEYHSTSAVTHLHVYVISEGTTVIVQELPKSNALLKI